MTGAHVSWRESWARPLEAEADYVVVGSGAGGAAAAVTLARSGASVAIVEAGPWRDPPDYPSSAWGGMRDLMDEQGGLITSGRALWPVVQARAVGGTTVINSAICVRTPDDIFTRWEEQHGLTGLRARVLAAQDRLERELSVEIVPPRAVGRSSLLAKQGADALGWSDSHYLHRYAKDCQGDGQCLQGCRSGRKQSLNVTYVPEVRSRGGLVLSCAPAERIELTGRRAVAVHGRFIHPTTRERGGRFSIRARRAVVVAASATRSAGLLMRSGVRSPALGHFFRAHPGTGVFGCYDQPVDMNLGATQGWASTAFRDAPGLKLETLAIPPELVASRLGGGGRQLMERLTRYRHLAMWVHAVRAESTGTVGLSLLGTPTVRYTLDRADMERFRHGMALVARQHFAAGARSVIPGISGLPFELGPDEVRLIEDGPLEPRSYLAILSHLFGGCVMGADPARSVVDARGRVHGVDGLVVADASVIPTNLGVNPQHTIMALAMVFAETLLSSRAPSVSRAVAA